MITLEMNTLHNQYHTAEFSHSKLNLKPLTSSSGQNVSSLKKGWIFLFFSLFSKTKIEISFNLSFLKGIGASLSNIRNIVCPSNCLDLLLSCSRHSSDFSFIRVYLIYTIVNKTFKVNNNLSFFSVLYSIIDNSSTIM